jgi:hypothetical protein
MRGTKPRQTRAVDKNSDEYLRRTSAPAWGTQEYWDWILFNNNVGQEFSPFMVRRG